MDEKENLHMDDIVSLKEQLSNEVTVQICFERKIAEITEEKRDLNEEIVEKIAELENVSDMNKVAVREDLINLLKVQITMFETNQNEKTRIINDSQEKNIELEHRISEVLDIAQKEKESVMQYKKEIESIKLQLSELNTLRSDFSQILKEKQALDSKIEEVSNENKFLTDEIKVLHANCEKLKKNSDSEELSSEKLILELNSLKDICTKHEMDIKTLMETNDSCAKKINESSSTIAGLNQERDSLLAEISTLRDIDNEFNQLSVDIIALRLTESRLKESLGREESLKLEMTQNIADLEENVATLNNINLKYRNSHNEVEVVCANLGLSCGDTSDALDIKTLLTNLANEKEKLSASLSIEFSKNERLSTALNYYLTELKATKENIFSKDTEICDLNKKISDLNCEMRDVEVTKLELEKTLSESKQFYTKEALEERISLVKSEVRGHYERVIENLREANEIELETWNSSWDVKYQEIKQIFEEKLKQITNEWNFERQELERLTLVAAEAFRNGTDSVDLLKKQVSHQRKEIDSLKQIH